MPPETLGTLKTAIRTGRVRWVEADVVAARLAPGGVSLSLDREPGEVTAARVVLATGFSQHRPGGGLLDDAAIDRLGLPCAACGYPIVSPRLEWTDGLFVAGPLSELELGPTARNISGARSAAARLVDAA